MTRMKMLAVALAVWGLGAITATALAYDLNRAPVPRGPTVEVTSIHTSAPEVTRRAGRDGSVLTIPTITIVSHRVATPLGVTSMQKSDETPDVSRMHCADWRNLQMGTGRVQICE